MAHFSDTGESKGKDYCIFFNSQWARLPQDLSKAVSLTSTTRTLIFKVIEAQKTHETRCV